jgi:hypothetical protein
LHKYHRDKQRAARYRHFFGQSKSVRGQPPEIQELDIYHLISLFLTPTQRRLSLTYVLLVSTWGLCLPQPVSLLRHGPYRHPSVRLAQAIFGPSFLPYKYPNNLIPVILPAYTTYEDGTDSVPKRRHIKFRHRGITFTRDKYPKNLIPVILPAYTAYEDGTECFETSAYKIHMRGNYPTERIQQSKSCEARGCHRTQSRIVTVSIFDVPNTRCLADI